MPVMTTFQPTTFTEQAALFERYKRQIMIPYDDFLEDHILASDVYAIVADSVVIGFFGVQQQLLTIFFLDDAFFPHAAQILGQIREQHGVKEAFVPTTDLAALVVLLEQQQTIAIQALHFSATDRVVRPAEFGRELLRLATPADLAEIEQIAADFLDKYPERIARKQLYVLEQHGEIWGLGCWCQTGSWNAVLAPGCWPKQAAVARGSAARSSCTSRRSCRNRA
ncbi:MAG: hypothetical protein Fur005_23320 [Roseiflexaceae bacterium]